MNLHIDLYKDKGFKEVKIGKEDIAMVGILVMRMLFMGLVLGLATTLMGKVETSLMVMKMDTLMAMRVGKMIGMRMMKR